MMSTLSSEVPLLETYEVKRGFGVVWSAASFLSLGLPFLGRPADHHPAGLLDRDERRYRDIPIRDTEVKSMEARTEEQHLLKGVPSPDFVSEVIRNAWNAVARPKGPAAALD